MSAHLVSYRDDRTDLVFPLSEESGTLIGRDAGCMVQLTDARTSKRHALIRKEDDEWVVQDLGSRNGTRVNGADLAKPTVLNDGDRVRFGPVEFEFTTRSFDDAGFAPGHVIDLSSNAAQQTLQRVRPEGAE